MMCKRPGTDTRLLAYLSWDFKWFLSTKKTPPSLQITNREVLKGLPQK
jgi:hypothetical protein